MPNYGQGHAAIVGSPQTEMTRSAVGAEGTHGPWISYSVGESTKLVGKTASYEYDED